VIDQQTIDRRLLLMGGATVVGVACLGLSRAQAAKSAQAFEVIHTDAEWRALLPPASYQVLRHEGTEAPRSSPLDHFYKAGVYSCAGCGLPDFESKTKFDSKTGWPSFYAPIKDSVETTTDRALGMTRTEVHCRRCGSHLGHVFDDGPKPTGRRYCMNGVALKFTAT
jgi:peptide-methionine (R)-S-oxide reductase